ncbi:unnamed protein product [Acanthoscelides obtectus]|uniref:THAP-type domain-containing protein n=1 Tax=Acanthoscelides obtectus TaxID=200917 RepID=A0A9P0KU48_ACAOB|nr:unnamed protein product [Acanthoscelides obtectus]CAK1670248.1 hypothetical protein AOBTE_LOCUS27506 [Acanthoscelides obtectus]
MPKRCCVPGCKGNYEAELRSTPYRSVFRFPKNGEFKSKWLASIPRKDWSPSKDSVVCDAHFQQAEIVRTETYVLQDGSANTVTLSRPKLSGGAVPSVFPNVPSYLKFLVEQILPSDKIRSFKGMRIWFQNFRKKTKLQDSHIYWKTILK